MNVRSMNCKQVGRSPRRAKLLEESRERGVVPMSEHDFLPEVADTDGLLLHLHSSAAVVALHLDHSGHADLVNLAMVI